MDKYLAGLKLAAEALKLALNLIVEKVPTAAPAVQDAIAKIEAALAGDSAMDILQALNVPAELLDIVKGKLDPHDHPSDGA